MPQSSEERDGDRTAIRSPIRQALGSAVLRAENDDRCDGDDGHDDRQQREAEWVRPAPFGPGYVDNLTATADQVVSADVLDRVLTLSDRWPEPRSLQQTEVFFLRDRTPVYVTGLGPDGARRLLEHVRGLTVELHEAAVCDEDFTSSSAMLWAMEQAGIPRVADLEPAAWLESTPLVRCLAERAR